MKTLTTAALLVIISAFLRDKKSFTAIRGFVYEYYESETDCKLDRTLKKIFPVLAPYLEYEEAFGDLERKEKLQRLCQVLQLHNPRPEHAVFALNFDQIQEIHRKLEEHIIKAHVYNDQLRKLSPTDFDAKKIALWAIAHKDSENLVGSQLDLDINLLK